MSSKGFAMSPEDIETRIDSILSEMSREEKLGQTAMRGIWSREKGLPESITQDVKDGKIGAFLNVITPEKVDELQRVAVEESRAGIPLIFSRDVIHGFRTAFPIPLGLASTWNPDIAYSGARVSAIEATVFGIRWTFGPMMDIARDPRWGRIAESFGEDPYLASEMAVAMVKGFQTDDLSDPLSIAACAKHFAGYGAAEGGRDYNTTLIPDRELRDVYLRPFRAASDAGVATMMTSFNEIDGIPASGYRGLLKDILRGQWGFDGFLVSDWSSITEMIKHGFVADPKEAALKAFRAGLNMEMMSEAYDQHLLELIDEGLIDESWLDEMVRQILRVKFRLGLFENPYRVKERENVILAPEHLAKAKEAAIQSAVLLKNKDDLLPLSVTGTTVAVIGPMANALHDQMGTWVLDGRAENSRVPLEAIREMIGDESVHYAPGLEYSRSKSKDGFPAAIEAAKTSDIILFFAGEESFLSGEAHSRADISLPGAQNKLIETLSALGKPLVLVVMSGRPNTISNILPKVDAVMIAFHSGTMAGPAIADLLFGLRSPSGRLPVTWPIAVGQIPIYYNHKNTGRPSSDADYVQIDDIPPGMLQSSLGNKSHYLDIGFRPAFPFGYGLTYGEFDYSGLQLDREELTIGESMEISAVITNTGKREATEVVQLYVRDLVGDVTRPVRELKGFQRVTLKPGESETVVFTLSTDDLTFHNQAMQEVVEPGDFKVWVAPNAVAGLEGSFRVVE
jgi:beta-glucosidase